MMDTDIVMKDEPMDAPQTTPSTATTTNTTSQVRKRPWEKPGGVKIKRKKVPGAKNNRVRRYVKPKNAVTCLNDLRSGLTYVTEQEGNVGTPYCVMVLVDGKVYRGYGPSKQLAKQAAAETALISFVQPPVVGDATKDETPWVALASFAIFKLFKEWQEKEQSPGPVFNYPGPNPYFGGDMGLRGFPQYSSLAMGPSAGLVTGAKSISARTNKGAKTLPANAASMHPVMVLHQMIPQITYSTDTRPHTTNQNHYLSAVIEGQTFYGEGSTLKKAKFALAKDAIKSLYNVDSTFENPAAN